MYPIVVSAAVIGLAVYCITQLIVCRALPGRNPYISLAIGWLLGFLSTGAATIVPLWLMHEGVADAVAYGVLNTFTYLALAFGYFNFVNLNIASLRIRLLEELQDAGGSVAEAALLVEYNTENMMATRFDRLVRGGHLLERDGRFYSGKQRFLLVARTFDGVRWIVFGRDYLAVRTPL